LSGPDFIGIVLNPAGLREVLREFALGGGDWLAMAVKENGARRGRALVKG
jgi:hypothetical protein